MSEGIVGRLANMFGGRGSEPPPTPASEVRRSEGPWRSVDANIEIPEDSGAKVKVDEDNGVIRLDWRRALNTSDQYAILHPVDGLTAFHNSIDNAREAYTLNREANNPLLADEKKLLFGSGEPEDGRGEERLALLYRLTGIKSADIKKRLESSKTPPSRLPMHLKMPQEQVPGADNNRFSLISRLNLGNVTFEGKYVFVQLSDDYRIRSVNVSEGKELTRFSFDKDGKVIAVDEVDVERQTETPLFRLRQDTASA